MKEVLVLGGYGGFGARVAIQLARRGFAVTVAGRNLAKAQAFCSEHPDLPLRPLALDRSAAPGDGQYWLAVDAAGPFQGSDYRVAEGCIAAGCHYFDLADARDFVRSIVRLDRAAKEAGVTVISGASSLPALSAAVADRLASGLDSVGAIDVALSASNRASGGVSTTRAILSYVGSPIRLWRGGAWRNAFGWQEIAKVRFQVPGRRPLRKRVAICDVPDLDILPERYAGRPAVRFRAGTEIELQNIVLWLLSWPVRWGWLGSLRGLTRPAVWMQRALGRIGGDRSAMQLVLKGRIGETAVQRRWTVLAEQGHGPWIPALAVPLLADRLLAGLPTGARSAAGSLTLEEFEKAFLGLSIRTADEETRIPPLYARVMGPGFERLAPAVRVLHEVNGDLAASGIARVTRGGNPVARAIGRIMGFPPAADEVPLSVWMCEEEGVETWRRDFGGACFESRLSQDGDLLVERFGALRFAMELRPRPGGLSMHFRRWWVGPLRMPLFLAPRGIATEREVDGRFHFDVPIALPLVGLLVHYRGWLTPAEAA